MPTTRFTDKPPIRRDTDSSAMISAKVMEEQESDPSDDGAIKWQPVNFEEFLALPDSEIETLRRDLIRCFRAYGPEDVEDIVDEALFNTLRQLNSHPDKRVHPFGYVRRAAQNVVAENRRRFANSVREISVAFGEGDGQFDMPDPSRDCNPEEVLMSQERILHEGVEKLVDNGSINRIEARCFWLPPYDMSEERRELESELLESGAASPATMKHFISTRRRKVIRLLEQKLGIVV